MNPIYYTIFRRFCKGKNGGKIASFHVISRVHLTFLFFLL